MTPEESCDVCGRTMLAGERTRPYLTPDHELRGVCELCRSRAERLGWVWEELARERPPAAATPRRQRLFALGARLRKRRPRVAAPPEEAGVGAEEPTDDVAAPPPSGQQPAAPAPAAAPRAPRPISARVSDPAAPGANVGRPAAPRESAQSRLERAIDRFNVSPESHTVGGLMRSLGKPWVSVGTIAGSPSEVRITVAWELCWYQWGVDVGDELRPVFQIDKGDELDQLDGPARQWNASAAEGGQVRLGSAAAAAPAAGAQRVGG